MEVKTHLQLNTGALIPSIGFGTWQAGGNELEAAVNSALEAGYRHIDTAAFYQNEEVIGNVIHEWISSERVTREELFIVTKLPPSGNNAASVEQFVEESLKKLQLEYIDLYLIHVPFGFKGPDLHAVDDEGNTLIDTETNLPAVWAAMEESVKSGKLKAIGLSNFNKEQIERVMAKAEIKPANLQVEMHVYNQQKELLKYCQENGILLTAYSPLGSRGIIKIIGEREDFPDLINDRVVMEIANNLGKSPAQVLLRFLLENGVIVIPKSTNEERIKSNLQVFDFELGSEFFQKLSALDRGSSGRIVDFSFFKGVTNHPEYPFRD